MFLDLIKDKITALSNYACTNEWDRNWVYELMIEKIINELSRGEICVANFKAPCEWCEFGQVFNGQSEWWYGPFELRFQNAIIAHRGMNSVEKLGVQNENVHCMEDFFWGFKLLGKF